VFQTATITRYDDGVPTVLATNVPVAPNFVGPVSMPDYEPGNQAITTLPDGSKVIGPRDDPFFVDLARSSISSPSGACPATAARVSTGGGFNCMTTRPGADDAAHARRSAAEREEPILGIYDR
jgi:hypothetical protein